MNSWTPKLEYEVSAQMRSQVNRTAPKYKTFLVH